MELRGLTPPHGEPGTETAQRFLASAYDSVEAVLQTLNTVRQQRRLETGRTLRRLTSPEEDLLRAAIVFTGAGLDATLKQLIRDALPACSRQVAKPMTSSSRSRRTSLGPPR